MHESAIAPVAAPVAGPGRMAAVLTAVLIIAAPPPAAGMTIAGIDIPETLSVGDHTLVLNGAGLRKKLFVDAYVACLYLADHDRDPQRILDADEPQAVIMHVASELVTRKRLTDSLPRDLRRSTGNQLESIRSQTDQLLAMFDDEVAAGDVFRMVYLPGTGTQVWHNERLKGTIEGLEFKRALFGIWLSEQPTQPSLKLALLHAGSAE